MASLRVTKMFTFDAAHALTRYYGKCENLHGHTYRLEVTVEGQVQDNGMVVDFVLLKRVVARRVLDRLDHQNLNDLFENSSAENVVLWIWEQLADMNRLLREELKDPNLGENLKRYLATAEVPEPMAANEADEAGAVRLVEVKLAETPDNIVTYCG